MSEKCRDVILKEKILNSSEKKMKLGMEPGPIKSTAEIRRGTRRRKESRKKPEPKSAQPINTSSKNK